MFNLIWANPQMFNSTPWFACNKEPCYFYSSHQGQVIEATKKQK